VKRPIYQSVAINDVTVRNWPHDDVVNLQGRRRTRRFASLTLMTSRDNDARRDPLPPTARRAAAAIAPIRRPAATCRLQRTVPADLLTGALR